jgi:hypothetical protein
MLVRLLDALANAVMLYTHMNKYIQIDNFFSDPDSIRKLALQQTYRPRRSDEYFEGQRSPQVHMIDPALHSHASSRIITEYYGVSSIGINYTASTFFHKTTSADLTDTQWLNDRVHTDLSILSAIVYLTPGAELDTGTQTYARVNDEYQPDIIMSNHYNRLVVYPGNRAHSAITLADDRLTFLFFLESIDLDV